MARFFQTSTIIPALLAFFLINPGRAANLVTNGSFETGSFSGWTTYPAAVGSNFGVTEADPYSGSYAAYFNDAVAGNRDGIGQTIATSSGEIFQLTFWLAINTVSISPEVRTVRPLFTPNDSVIPDPTADFEVLWNGSVIGDFSSSSGTGYSEYTLTLPAATSGSSSLGFEAYNAGSGTFLDSVYLAPESAPEPRTLCLIGAALVGLGLIRVVRKVRLRPVQTVRS